MSKKLLEWIYPEKDRWALQVIQHALALYSYVPVRIWDWNLQPEKPQTYQMEQEWDDTIGGGAGLGKMPDPLVDRYANRNSSYWLTLPRNILPLEEYLRREKRWIAWQNYVIGKWLREVPENDVAFFHGKMRIAARRLKMPGKERKEACYLIVGPLFVINHDSKEKGISGTKGELEELAEGFRDKVLEGLSESSASLRVRGADLKLLGGSRSWIGALCLDRRPKMLQKALEAIFDIDVDLKDGQPIRNKAFHSLVRHVILLQNEFDRILDEKTRRLNFLLGACRAGNWGHP